MSQMGRGAGTLGGQFHFRVLFHEHSTTTIPSLSVNIELRMWCFWVFEGLEINTEHGCIPPPLPRVVFQISGLCGNLPES